MASDSYGLEAIASFYRWNATIYDATRPFILFDREEAVSRLQVEKGNMVLDVGCGTGFNLPMLLRLGARVAAIEPSAAMLERLRAKTGNPSPAALELDDEPYGSHARYEARVDRILFSYSLSMIPPFRSVIERARRDLRPGGRIAVVDFLEAWPDPFRSWLSTCHVFLGEERLKALQSAFPLGATTVRKGPLWSYFLFDAEVGP